MAQLLNKRKNPRREVTMTKSHNKMHRITPAYQNTKEKLYRMNT